MTNTNGNKSKGGQDTSSSLLERLRSTERDPDAWERFVALYQPLVLDWCRRGRLQSADADDVTAEVFRSVHRAIARFKRGGAGTFRRWLREITRNAICDLARARAREAQGAGGSDAQAVIQAVPEVVFDDVDEERDRDEQRMLLRKALRAILANYKDQTREAFWRVVVEGRCPAEVAREMAVEEHVVYLAKSRILKRLREEYGDLLDM